MGSVFGENALRRLASSADSDCSYPGTAGVSARSRRSCTRFPVTFWAKALSTKNTSRHTAARQRRWVLIEILLIGPTKVNQEAAKIQCAPAGSLHRTL